MKNKFYKLLSIALSVMLVLSCFIAVLPATAETTETETEQTGSTESTETAEHIYYVSSADSSPAGDDTNGDGSAEKPFLTVSQAIAKAAAAATDGGYNSPENTVYLKITGTVGWGTRKDINVTETNGTVINPTNGRCLPNFDFTLNISSAQETEKGVISGTSAAFLGPVEFENISVKLDSYTRLALNSNDVKVFDTATVSISGGNFVLGIDAGSLTVNDEQDVYIGGSIPDVYIGNNYSSATYNADINLTYDYANSKTLYLGSNQSGQKVTFNKNLNFNLKNSTGITLGDKNFAFGSDAAVQIINSTGNTVSYGTKVKNAIFGTEATDTTEAVAPTVDSWILTNTTTDYKDVLGFYTGNDTTVKGKFTVAEGYKVTAVKNGETEGITVEAPWGEGGKVLDLSASSGEYDVTIERLPKTYTYYIASETDGGNSDNTGLSTESPLLTVNDVVTKASAVATSIDTVEIKVVGTAAAATWGTDIDHSFKKLVIKSNNLEDISTINTSANGNGGSKSYYRLGDIEFKNIKISGTSSITRFYATGRNVTFGDGVNVGLTVCLSDQEDTITNSQTIIFNNAFTSNMHVGQYNYGGITFKKDVNIFYNNPSAKAKISFATGTGGTNTLNQNLNLVIYDASSMSVTARNNVKYTIKGAVQLITPSDITVDTTNITALSPAGGLYHIVNDTGVANGVELVPADNEGNYEVGKYKLNVDRSLYDVYVTEEGGEAELISGDILELTKAGKYTVSVERKPQSKIYYVNAQGDDETGDGTKEDPFATVTAVVKAANSDERGYIAGDKIYVKVQGTTMVSTGATIPTHAFTLIIESETDGACVGYTATDSSLALGGPTEFKNIEITVKVHKQFRLINNDLKLHEGVTFTDNLSNRTIAIGGTSDNSSTTDPQNLEFNSYATKIYIGDSNYGRTFLNQLNLTYNHSSSPTFYLGTSTFANNGISTYKNQVNFNIKEATGITFSKSTLGYTFADGSVLQIINSAGIEIGSDTGELTNIDSAKKWIITNKTDNIKDALGFVEGTAGKYTVAEGYTVTAYDAENNLVATSADGYLDIAGAGEGYSAGEYTVYCTQEGDINADADTVNYDNNVYDIRDLVYVSEQIKADQSWYNAVADKNGDNIVNSDDIAIIRYELLTGELYTPDTESEGTTETVTLSAVDGTDKIQLLSQLCDRNSSHYDLSNSPFQTFKFL